MSNAIKVENIDDDALRTTLQREGIPMKPRKLSNGEPFGNEPCPKCDSGIRYDLCCGAKS